MRKDKTTGKEVIDYDFLGKKLYPPKKLRVTDAGKEIAALFREIDKFYYKRKDYSSDNNISFNRSHFSQKQPCTVKMYYTPNKKNHINFLRNYMPQKNKKEVAEKPKLFNGLYDDVPESEIQNYEKNADDLGFKFIISPECQTVDMKSLVRQFVSNLETFTGNSFSWLAVTHTDTEHIHSHILINGIDKKTKEKIHFKREVITSIARNLAINICTDLAGYRSREQIESSKSRLPSSKRWTKLDELIVNNYGYKSFNTPRIISGCEFEASKVTSDNLEIQRLNYLVKFGFAICYDKDYPRIYYLEKGWKDKLRAVGRYNTYLEARNELRFTPYYNLELYDSDMGEIQGIITKIYNMNDENIWSNSVVIENKKLNKSWYVPIRYKLSNDDLGKAVSIKSEKNQKGKIVPIITEIR